MSSRSLLFASLFGVIALCSTQPLAAQAPGSADDEARAIFEAGRVAYARGRYEKALEHFKEAHELSKRPALLFNIGNALDRLRRDEEALHAFENFVAAEPNSPSADTARERIQFLRAAIEKRKAAPPAGPAPVPPPVAPTPAETAQTAMTPTTSEAPAEATRADEPVTGKWWFWTGIGVVAAAAIVGIVAASSGGDETVEDPALFDDNTRTVGL